MMLRDRTVLISGAGPGLGRRVAEACMRDGANVVLGARSPDALAQLAGALDPAGERIAHRPADITDDEQCGELAALAVERFGGVDAVVHVAALDTVFGGLEDAGPGFAEWRDVLEVNLLGTLRMTRACVPSMKRRGGGSVVFIGTQSSVAAPSQVRQAAYAASKGALVSAMYSLAGELGPHRIRVNTVQPGWMWGPPVQGYVRWQAAQEGVSEDVVLGRLTSRMALPEPATDGDVAESAVFLASERARAITGQCLLVNAGEVMR